MESAETAEMIFLREEFQNCFSGFVIFWVDFQCECRKFVVRV
jgi:hypothetical protein